MLRSQLSLCCLQEYVIVLLKNGRRKEEAKNELKIFLADDSDSFVAWYVKCFFLPLLENVSFFI